MSPTDDDERKVIEPTSVLPPKNKHTNATSFKPGHNAVRNGGGRMALPQIFKDRVKAEVLPEILAMALDKSVEPRTRLQAGIWCAERVMGKATQGHEMQGTAADALAAFANAITAKQLPSTTGGDDFDNDEDEDVDEE